MTLNSVKRAAMLDDYYSTASNGRGTKAVAKSRGSLGTCWTEWQKQRAEEQD